MAEVYVIERGQIVKKNHALLRCSVCGLWHDKYAYGLNEQGNRTRTNCTSCYNLKTADYKAMKEKWGCLDSYASYGSLWRGDTPQLIHETQHRNAVLSNAISKKEMLEQLQDMIRKVNTMPEESMFLGSEYDQDGGMELSTIEMSIGKSDRYEQNAYYVSL